MFVFGMILFLNNVRCFFLTFNGPKSTPREILYYSRCFLIKQGTFLLRIVGPLNCPSEKAIIITKWGREFKQLCISLNRNIRPLPHCHALIIYILIKWLNDYLPTIASQSDWARDLAILAVCILTTRLQIHE